MVQKKQIKKELQNEKVIMTCAEQFGLIGDPTRMKICWLLCEHPELSVGEIADMLGVEISTISHSLGRLREHALVTTRRDHKHVYYRLSPNEFNTNLKHFITKL